jgi:hypothetical protein
LDRRVDDARVRLEKNEEGISVVVVVLLLAPMPSSCVSGTSVAALKDADSGRGSDGGAQRELAEAVVVAE